MKFRSRLIVNLSHLAYNYNLIKKMAPQSEIIFMVKADAYGHGMIPLVRYVVTELGGKEFGCATLSEALNLRIELNDLEFEIYVFSDVQLEHQNNSELYLTRRLIPVLSNMSELDYILHLSESRNLPICLKFNTGMNRLGLDPLDAPLIVHKLKQHGRLSVHHLISHYANASYPMESDERNIFQDARFNELKKFFQDSGIHVERTSRSNSGAIAQKKGFEESHIRPGLMMYGPSSLNKENGELSHFEGKIISRLETYILKVFDVVSGTPVGYNSTPCSHDGVIAVLAIGYGDGFSTHYAGAHLYHKGFEGVVMGRVNMDMIQVLFPVEARGHILPHEIFTIWGEKEGDFIKFLEETKTIPYEIFCSLLPRIPRVYRIN